MKNIHTRVLLIILVLIAGATWAVIAKPTRKGLDIQGGMRVVLQANPTTEKEKASWSREKLETIAAIMHKRVDALGVAEPLVYPQGDDRVIVELPAVKDPKKAREIISTTAKLEFRYVKQLESEWRHDPEYDKIGRETGYETIKGSDGKPLSPEELDAKIFSEDPILEGKDLEANSRADLIPQKGYIIHFEFKGDKKSTFEDFTRTHVGKPLAIFLDKKLISAPNINEPIPGEGIIEGRFSAEQAKTLASQLNAGALPVPLKTVDEIQVEATLGNAAVRQTTIAGAVGLGCVLVFMASFYLLPGLIACVALLLYALFTFAAFKLIPVTLTVPGIAGFILSIGMAVDANILIFERFKEERKSGKSLRSAIETGFSRAMTAIVDSNVCTLITCGILYHFGTGSVQGFALTLAVGVAISMFTAITVSRTFMLLVASAPWAQNDALYGLNRGFHPRLGVTKRMGMWFAFSGIIIVPGIVFWAMGGIKQSIEFTGGTEIAATFPSRVSATDIEGAMKGLGFAESRVLLAEGGTKAFTTIRASEKVPKLDATQQTQAEDALKGKGGTIESVQGVSGTISGELIRNAILSVVYASLLIILYLAIRFSIPNFVEGLKFGTCAVIALLHDVGVLWGLFAITGYLFNWKIDSLFVTAMLTVIGFSVHDTIIIFDRIRENLRHKAKGESFAEVTDRSIEQTFARSINTSGTVVITLLWLLILGGPVIKLFVTALFIGIISGTYSSIFNASPLLVLWKRWTGDAATPTAVSGGPARGAAGVARPVAAPRPRPQTLPPTSQPATAGPALTPTRPEPVDAEAAERARVAKAKAKKKRRM